jgi:TonB family protein
MKKPVLVAAFLLCCLQRVWGGVDPALQQSLIVAKQHADLSYDQHAPFQLDVDFVAQLNVPIQGHLTLKWEGKDRWWRKVVFGDFQQTEAKNGEWHYTARNADFTPLRVGNLVTLLDLGDNSENLIAKREKHRSERGVVMNCIEVEHKGYFESSRNVCLDSASNEILVDEWKEPPDEQRRLQYSDYFDFGRHRYPRKLERFEDGSKVVTAEVVNLVSAPFDESLLTPPQGAIARRECADLKHAVAVRDPDPIYPKSASNAGLMGDTAVAMTVLADGSVANIRLVGSATRSMDDATLQTLESWKFRPAMCGSEPVVTDITVVVSFRLSN